MGRWAVRPLWPSSFGGEMMGEIREGRESWVNVAAK